MRRTKDKGESKVIKKMTNSNIKKIAMVLVILVVLILSMTVISKAASDPANHTETLESVWKTQHIR